MFNLNPNPNPDHFEIINDIQESFREKQIRYVIFHDGINYTVTPELERAFATNKPFYAVSYYNVHYLGVVPKGKEEEVRAYFEKVSAIEKEERSVYETSILKPMLQEIDEDDLPFFEDNENVNIREFDEDENPFNVPYTDKVDIDDAINLFATKKPLKYQPILDHLTLATDIYLIVGHELGYSVDEINEQLEYLGRMLPLYNDYLKQNPVETDMAQLSFAYEKVLSSFNKSPNEIELFLNVTNEKILISDDANSQRADQLLSELILFQLGLQ